MRTKKTIFTIRSQSQNEEFSEYINKLVADDMILDVKEIERGDSVRIEITMKDDDI